MSETTTSEASTDASTEASAEAAVTETTDSTEATTEVNDAPKETQPEPVDELTKLAADVKNWTKRSRQHEDNAKALLAEKNNWTKAREEYEAKLSKVTTALEEKTAQLQLITIQATKTKLAAEYKLPEPALKLLTATDEEGLKAQAIVAAEAIAAANPGFAQPQPLSLKNQGQTATGRSTDPARAAFDAWERENLRK